MNAQQDYWTECLAQAFGEAGIAATDDQLKLVVRHVEGAHETYGMAFYQPASPYPSEVKRLEIALSTERAKRGCSRCRGTGRMEEQFGPIGRWSSGPCDTCHGEGKVSG